MLQLCSVCFLSYDVVESTCEEVTGAMRIYLDMCCYNRPYDDQSQLRVHLETQAKLHIQDMIKTGNLSLIGSYTLDYEVSQNPFEARKKAIRQFVDQNMTAYVGVERDTPVSAIAEEIMRSGVKEKDAYHVAAAIYASCDYFITTDYRLLKYRDSRIRLCSPIDFIIETEGEP